MRALRAAISPRCLDWTSFEAHAYDSEDREKSPDDCKSCFLYYMYFEQSSDPLLKRSRIRILPWIMVVSVQHSAFTFPYFTGASHAYRPVRPPLTTLQKFTSNADQKRQFRLVTNKRGALDHGREGLPLYPHLHLSVQYECGPLAEDQRDGLERLPGRLG